jgi:hypothetical protein
MFDGPLSSAHPREYEKQQVSGALFVVFLSSCSHLDFGQSSNESAPQQRNYSKNKLKLNAYTT